MEKSIAMARNSAALRAIMQYKSVSMADLAKGSGVSYRTIEGYCYGQKDIAYAKAYNVIQIEHFLEIDGRILTGSKSIDDFYETENKNISKQEQTGTFVVADSDFDFRRNQLERMMAYYREIVKN